ncbi:MAG: putative transcriptional regulator [Flavobacteriales bacterium]|jgi:putative transcriptional regulator
MPADTDDKSNHTSNHTSNQKSCEKSDDSGNKKGEFMNLRNQFLIAMPGLKDSLFSHAVAYICDHNEEGAMGIVINQTLDITLDDVFSQLELTVSDSKPYEDRAVLSGGPVNSEQGLVLHRDQGQWDSTLHITPEVCLTASRDIISAMAKGEAPKDAQLALGYAGWSAGQLESEIAENCWLTMPADAAIIFDIPAEERWNAAANQLGIDLNLISGSAGHA